MFTLRRCLFIDNSATEKGGAAHVAHSLVEDCVFFRNSAPDGAALMLGPGCVLHGCTFLNNTAALPYGSCLWVEGDVYVPVERCIIAGTMDGLAVNCWGAGEFYCCDFWDNDLGVYEGWCGIAESYGNIFADPLFCDVSTGDVGLLPGSPCLPGAHGGYECGLIGARGLGCGYVPVLGISWGRLRSLYR